MVLVFINSIFNDSLLNFQNIDLHALTGWIPERKPILPSEPDFNADSLFDMLLSRIKNGNVLATVATGELSEHEAERAGLVPTHAYAVLDVKRVNVRTFHNFFRIFPCITL